METKEAQTTIVDNCPVCGDELVNPINRNGQLLCSEYCADTWDEMESIREDLFSE